MSASFNNKAFKGFNFQGQGQPEYISIHRPTTSIFKLISCRWKGIKGKHIRQVHRECDRKRPSEQEAWHHRSRPKHGKKQKAVDDNVKAGTAKRRQPVDQLQKDDYYRRFR
jgi:hypothetical protein